MYAVHWSGMRWWARHLASWTSSYKAWHVIAYAIHSRAQRKYSLIKWRRTSGTSESIEACASEVPHLHLEALPHQEGAKAVKLVMSSPHGCTAHLNNGQPCFLTPKP